jgi:acyl-[acyl-carrier-protein]-phospholipid O-acyltransferase / long-chain-fatty-acid--[acyl-carrier-protein] ligase
LPGICKDNADTGFSQYNGKQRYNTGDFVKEDEDGVITFCGRKKRFVKLGGEMISLPVNENALFTYYPADTGNGPTLAVESTPDEERPEIVLFTTLPLVRDEVNAKIKEAGLSPLHNIRIMKDIEKIPVLGTGKTDYKLLKQMLSV